MGLLDIFGTGDQKAAANDQIMGINTGFGDLAANVAEGTKALNTNFTAGLQPFLTNYATGQQGTTALGNALGLNGAGGNAAAVAAFMNNPGYTFQKQQGDDAINAAEAASGKTFSGNQLLDLSKYNQGLAGTSWNQYLSNLQPYLGYSTNAASGIGNLYAGLGQGVNANWNKTGDAAYGAATSAGNALANKDLAGLNASANSLGAIGGLVSSLFSFL